MPILHIRDENGNFVPIKTINGKNGQDGKSAYKQAKEGGYRGTEAEFIASLNKIASTEDEEHYANFNNPHRVTAEQVGLGNVDNTSDMDKPVSTAVQERLDGITASSIGAIPSAYSVSSDLNTQLQEGGNKFTICGYGVNTLNTPYKAGLTTFSLGIVLTNAYSKVYSTQICIPTGDDCIFARKLNGTSISAWEQIAGKQDNIMTAPNGDKFRLSVDNDGVLTTEPV